MNICRMMSSDNRYREVKAETRNKLLGFPKILMLQIYSNDLNSQRDLMALACLVEIDLS